MSQLFISIIASIRRAVIIVPWDYYGTTLAYIYFIAVVDSDDSDSTMFFLNSFAYQSILTEVAFFLQFYFALSAEIGVRRMQYTPKCSPV